jgi:DNA-directed RNA polymerase specialized sigma24 family protein
MFGFRKEKSAVSNARYASRADYCRIFQEGMRPLYLLSFLLLANHARAEQCYVESFHNAVEGYLVFEEWAYSWSKRALIQNAIRLVFSDRVQSEVRDVWDESSVGAVINIVAQLAPLERFVFVMSVLERYSDHDCSRLLNCTVQDVRDARVQALRSLGSVEPGLQIPLSSNEWNVKLSGGECA